jgi:very-short-patch-repair endonuclease
MPKNDAPRLEVPPEIRRKMVEAAREFRKQPSRSEAILWKALRGKQLDGLKFRRQQPVGQFIVDFYNSDHRLVIEVDGPIHDFQRRADRARQELLEVLGLKVLRLNAEMIENNLPAALDLIRGAIKAARTPSPLVGEGRGGAR